MEATQDIIPIDFVEAVDREFQYSWDSFTKEIAETFTIVNDDDYEYEFLSQWEGATLALYADNAEWRDWMPTWYGDVTYKGRTYAFRWDSYYRDLTWKETK
jgi:hypothetical protein